MKENQDIRNELKKYKITYKDLLKYIPNFSHETRISEELKKPLDKERTKVYLSAIADAKKEKKKLYEN